MFSSIINRCSNISSVGGGSSNKYIGITSTYLTPLSTLSTVVSYYSTRIESMKSLNFKKSFNNNGGRDRDMDRNRNDRNDDRGGHKISFKKSTIQPSPPIYKTEIQSQENELYIDRKRPHNRKIKEPVEVHRKYNNRDTDGYRRTKNKDFDTYVKYSDREDMSINNQRTFNSSNNKSVKESSSPPQQSYNTNNNNNQEEEEESSPTTLKIKTLNYDIKKLNEDKKNEINISHIRPVLSIFQKRPEDIIKLYVEHKFYEENKLELKPLIKYLVEQKKTYKILDSNEESQEQLKKVSGSIHHGGICAIVKKRYTLDPNELFEKEIERSKLFTNSKLVTSHSFAAKFKQTALDKMMKTNSLGSGARPIVLFLDGVENPSNIGAIVRSSVLFGVESVIIHNEFDEKIGTINPYSAEAYRSSRGAVEYSNIADISSRRDAVDCLNRFVENGWEVVVTTSHMDQQEGRVKHNLSLYSNGSNKVLGLKPLVLVFGSETKGISKSILKTATASLSIPGTGLIDSLNVSQATSIILAECWRIQGKSLEAPNEQRVNNIRSGVDPLEITPKLLGIKDSDIYQDVDHNKEREQEDQDNIDEYTRQQQLEQELQQPLENENGNNNNSNNRKGKFNNNNNNNKFSKRSKSNEVKVTRNKKRL